MVLLCHSEFIRLPRGAEYLAPDIEPQCKKQPCPGQGLPHQAIPPLRSGLGVVKKLGLWLRSLVQIGFLPCPLTLRGSVKPIGVLLLQHHQIPVALKGVPIIEAFRNRNPHPGRPQPASSSTVPTVDLNATQATFLAGAAVHQAHQASMVAEHASNAALHFQQQAQVTQQNAVRQQAQFHQAATALQNRAEAYVRQAQEEARSAGVERDEVARQASQTVEGFRREAVAEVQATQTQLEARANQWLNENMSQIMGQMESRDARLRSQEDALRGRDEEIIRLQRELDSVRREALDREQIHARQREDLNRVHQEHLQQVALRHNEGLQSPVDVPLPITPRSNQTVTTQVQAFEPPPLPAPVASPGDTFVNSPTSPFWGNCGARSSTCTSGYTY